jgi:hypothetical protein
MAAHHHQHHDYIGDNVSLASSSAALPRSSAAVVENSDHDPHALITTASTAAHATSTSATLPGSHNNNMDRSSSFPPTAAAAVSNNNNNSADAVDQGGENFDRSHEDATRITTAVRASIPAELQLHQEDLNDPRMDPVSAPFCTALIDPFVFPKGGAHGCIHAHMQFRIHSHLLFVPCWYHIVHYVACRLVSIHCQCSTFVDGMGGAQDCADSQTVLLA